MIAVVINGIGTFSLASGWHTSSSCPLPRPSSQVDTSHLLWSPPGCCGSELVSLEPLEKHKHTKKIKNQSRVELRFQNKYLARAETYIFWGNRAMCLVIFLIVHKHVPVGIIFLYLLRYERHFCSYVTGSHSLLQNAFLQLLICH